MPDTFALIPFAGLLLVAAISDVATMKIPNWVSIALAASYPVVALITGQPLTEIGINLAFGFGVLVLCFGLFQFGIMGGGDAKLIAAAAVWTGLNAFLFFAGWMALAGGLIALVLLFVRRAVKPSEERPAFLNRLLKPHGGVPYGVAIAFGGLMALDIARTALTLP
ncbi:MAG: prepilin peptidase [Caulobacterales bacterium]